MTAPALVAVDAAPTKAGKGAVHRSTSWLGRRWNGLLGAFGLIDHCGNPSFTKLVIAVVVGSTLAGVVWPVTLATIVIAAAFGKSMFGGFLAKSTFTATSSDTIKLAREKMETVTRAITERRGAAHAAEHGTEDTD